MAQSGKLSDQIIDLSAKLPETKVLEAKLTKMVKLEPTVEKAVESVNALTKMPTNAELKQSESEVKTAVTKIEAAVHHEQSETEKKGPQAEEAPAKAPPAAAPTSQFIAQPAKAAPAPAKRDAEAVAVAQQMKSAVSSALQNQGLTVDAETAQEINEELKR